MQHTPVEPTSSDPRSHLDLTRPMPRVRLSEEGPAYLVEQLARHYKDGLETRRLEAVQVS